MSSSCICPKTLFNVICQINKLLLIYSKRGQEILLWSKHSLNVETFPKLVQIKGRIALKAFFPLLEKTSLNCQLLIGWRKPTQKLGKFLGEGIIVPNTIDWRYLELCLMKLKYADEHNPIKHVCFVHVKNKSLTNLILRLFYFVSADKS